MVCDDQMHLQYVEELLLMGQLYDNDERWEFYNAKNFERPSKKELLDCKAIIIGYSSHKIKNKVPRDDSIIKKLTMKKIVDTDPNKSEGGHESSNGSIELD